MTAPQRLRARVTGRVQGVGYRWWVRSRAGALGVTGWIMNEPDERGVAIVAEGTQQQLDELERLIRVGPSSARVEHVDARREPASGGFDRFEITRS